MRKLLITLLISTALGNVHGALRAKDVSFGYASGASSLDDNCSGSFVQSNNVTFFTSAAHCFEKAPEKSINTFVYDSRRRVQRSRSKLTLQLGGDQYFNREGDALLKAMPEGLKTKTKVLNVSKTHPSLGDALTAFGYPIVRGKRVATKLKCEFAGTMIYTTKHTPFAIGRLMKCFTNLKSVGGISGGPVINAEGDFLGVLSAEILPDKKFDFPKKRFLYMIYNEVSSELLEDFVMTRKVYDYIKFDFDMYSPIRADQEEFMWPSLLDLTLLTQVII